ncbi:hypothetical protein BU23DRAFT_549412 [Bimuria novae-zelandiae CBS 107.79]|uniref:Zn(2)-C6 fungal-type domain-containing protein n=1 Tax=Bimuria novae-zelandiae CBS 107.79 TaxID=1447943 RepID=A0A6A5VS54_9PLEO|nr:hypothetical protein BU23DRAFT_549412 [Bimuria novae-zelandiae CBS 107.79]
MTRPKVPPEQRQRTAQACESCKRRKQKCNGLCPCNTCDKRKFTCIYTERDAPSPSTSERPSKRQAVDGEQSPSVNDNSSGDTPISGHHKQSVSPLARPQSHSHGFPAPSRSALVRQEPIMASSSAVKRENNVFKIPGDQPSIEPGAGPLHQLAPGQLPDEPPPLISRGSTIQSGQDEEAVVFSQTRMLQDPTGRLLYVGDSATLSFLQLLRMMVENVAGPTPFTDDPRRHKIVEGQFSLPAGARHTHLLPDQRTARVLVDAFFINTHGLLQVFERHQFLERLDSCYSDPLSIEPSWLCILNLVFAIGLTMATPLSGSSEALIVDKLRSEHLDRAEVFYSNAKSLNDPMTGFEDQDFWSVQALLLMSVYMLAKSKRNTAFAQLGMATRSAQALGLHREETLVIFGPEEQKARKNLWRSLFVMDRLLSCLLGRPTAISESDCSGDSLRPSEAAPSTLKANFDETGAYALEAAVRSCSAIGLILKKVYQQRKISTRLAQEIADICKTWPRVLPTVLHWRQASSVTASQGVAILHVNLFYCHSIILLTRPFFLYILNMETQRQANQASAGNRAPRPYLRMEKFSEACVIASTHTILLVQNAFDVGYLSRRNPAVIYFLFAAALVVLANEFAGLYRSDSPDSCIANSIAIMSYCAESDQQASRLVYILSSFRDVVTQQRARRKQDQRDNLSLPSISSQLYGVSAPQATPAPGREGSTPTPRLHQVPVHIYPGMQTLPHSGPSGGFQNQLPQSGPPNLSVHLSPIQNPQASAASMDPYSFDGPSKPPSLSNVLDLSGLDNTRVPSLYSEESGADEQIDFDALWAWPSNTPAVGSPRAAGNGINGVPASTQGVSDSSVPLFGVIEGE